MREILFRGKRVDDREWVYGSLLQSEIDVNRISVKTFICERFADDAMLNKIEVIPETVGQHTGLKDTNGKDIYELMELNNKYRVLYKFNRYILQDISNSDIFVEIIQNDRYEITREYSPLP